MRALPWTALLRAPVILLSAWFGLALTTPARAASLPFAATLSVTTGFATPVVITGTGSGTGTSDGAGGGATLPGGTVGVGGVFRHPTTFLGISQGYAICTPGLSTSTAINVPASGYGSCAPHADGALGSLTFDGATGSGSLLASAYLTTAVDGMGQAMSYGIIPLSVLGVGGTAEFQFALLFGTVTGNPWQVGPVTSSGVLNGSTVTLTASGFDARSASGEGVLQLVTAAEADFGLGQLPAVAQLTIQFTPEPGTALLLGAGVAGIALMARRRAMR